MKPGLAILPLEVWADVSEHPMITRQLWAQIADNNGDPGFTEKLQKLLHECGKQTLHFLDISSKQPGKTTLKSIITESRASLAVAPDNTHFSLKDCEFSETEIPEDKAFTLPSIGHLDNPFLDFLDKINPHRNNPKCRAILAVSLNGGALSTYKECKFPETEMPANIKTFKQLTIRHLDDKVLGFLNKIKPLFNNVLLKVSLPALEKDMRILFGHLLPMLGSIRGIYCGNADIQFFEQYFPGTLALAKELDLFNPRPASIPACLNWLSAPQDFRMLGPRCLWAKNAYSKTIFAFVEAVREQFLGATISATFVICLAFYRMEQHPRADELKIENAATKEKLTIRNAVFEWPGLLGMDMGVQYVEILRHPIGADDNMREWVKKRAYFEKEYNDDEADKLISIVGPLTIGQITEKKEAKAMDQDKGQPADEAGPSTSAKKMEK